MTIIKAIFDWVTLRDYDAAKERATDEIVERLSRGNTLAQNGSALDGAELDKISRAADAAMERLAKRVA